MKVGIKFVVLLLSLPIVAYALLAYGFQPLGGNVHPEMMAVYEDHRLWIYLHIFASSLALLLGPIQFFTTIRLRWPHLHRWVGRIYLFVGVLIGGIAGLYMSALAFGGLMAKLGFAGLAIAWLFTGFKAYQAIRSGQVLQHQQWMLRNFALTFAAVTLRLQIPIALVALEVSFETAYPFIAWLCWLPNIVLMESYLGYLRYQNHRNDSQPVSG